jgi:fucose 4-O-acetylase-like acetyltransferase
MEKRVEKRLEKTGERRDLSIDIAKGIAIFSVVLAHLDTGLKGQIIYLFHMPFFFIASGYFHRTDRDEIGFLRKKCTSLLVPYFAYLIVLKSPFIFRYLVEALAQPSVESIKILLGYLARLLHGGYLLKGDVGVFWFVTCLFLTQQVYNFISVRVKSKERMVAIAFISYGLSMLDQISPVYLGLPWAANVVLGAFFFYAMGAIYGSYIFRAHSRLLIFWALVVSAVSIGLIALGFELSFSMKQAYYGFFILSPLAALALTKLLSFVSGGLAKIRGVADVLAYVGQACITVMFVHRTFEYSLPNALLYKNSILGACIVTALCCLVHQVFTRASVMRALFLGSRKDVYALTSGIGLNKKLRDS